MLMKMFHQMMTMNNVDNNALSATIAELQDLLTWPDGWNSYDALAPNSDAVAHAITWITAFYHHITSIQQQWIAPNVTASADGAVVFGWRHAQRSLEICIDEQDIYYLQAWGRSVNAKLIDGSIHAIDDMQQLWQWLLNGNGVSIDNKKEISNV